MVILNGLIAASDTLASIYGLTYHEGRDETKTHKCNNDRVVRIFNLWGV